MPFFHIYAAFLSFSFNVCPYISLGFSCCVSRSQLPSLLLGLPPLMMTCVLGIDFLIELSLSVSTLLVKGIDCVKSGLVQ